MRGFDRRARKRIALLSAMLLGLLCLPGPALAAEEEPRQDLTLTLCYEAEGASFEAYKVADIGEKNEMIPVEEFSFVNFDAEAEDLAETCANYIRAGRESLRPAAAASVSREGEALLRLKEAGVYLVLGEPCEYQGRLYTTNPMLISLPFREDTGEWNFHPAANAKFRSEPVPTATPEPTATPGPAVTPAPEETPEPTPEETPAPEDTPEPTLSPSPSPTPGVSLSAVKIWRDDGLYEDFHDRDVYVELYRDGELCGTGDLTQENGWRCSWSDLPEDGEYSLVEPSVTQYYNVTITREGDTFVVTNTIDLDEDTGVPFEEQRVWGPNGEVLPARRARELGLLLPKTGQLWWPVPYLILGGCVLTGIGFLRKRGR